MHTLLRRFVDLFQCLVNFLFVPEHSAESFLLSDPEITAQTWNNINFNNTLRNSTESR